MATTTNGFMRTLYVLKGTNANGEDVYMKYSHKWLIEFSKCRLYTRIGDCTYWVNYFNKYPQVLTRTNITNIHIVKVFAVEPEAYDTSLKV